ncbi:hypothetical protein CsatB_012662 [Cannabis sativa]|uniref:Uncharacterized protein n=2 Tax=Cannabis sativa TaxID=3483 RepID=A0AB40E6Y6_CANSA|nr:uncharacterized protein At4g22160 [Cannabis sativa]KAF4372596.1 hypothetical protein F8388_027269 [Cannabis sativa]KAF4379240.1 hypothetical protein G4B88_010634 [Cannabis sativa]KAF4399561.1 hypothetical protein G4B88_022644 [Cannabis sativa]
MAYQTNRTLRSQGNRDEANRLKNGIDAGLLSGAQPQDIDVDDVDSISNVSWSSDSDEADDFYSKKKRLTGLSASLRVLSDSLLRMEKVEAELNKTREALRLQAENRRLESEAELTQMMLRTELQIASFISRPINVSNSRKRKRIEEETSSQQVSVSQRDGALLFTLLQCSLLF